MKPFYNLGYEELFLSFFKFERRNRQLLIWAALFSVMMCCSVLFFIYNLDVLIILLMFVACVASMLPLRITPWLGAPDLNTVFTAYASITYGLPAGLFIGNASTIGILLSGDPDNNIIFDFAASYIIAIVASFFTMQYFAPVVIICAVIYATLALFFHYYLGTFEVVNTCWTITNFLWVLLLMLKIIPLLQKVHLFS